MKTIKQICEKSWNESLDEKEIKKVLSVKRYKFRTNFAVHNIKEFFEFVRGDYYNNFLKYGIDPDFDLFYSVIYLWNGRGYSALFPYSFIKEEGN